MCDILLITGDGCMMSYWSQGVDVWCLTDHGGLVVQSLTDHRGGYMTSYWSQGVDAWHLTGHRGLVVQSLTDHRVWMLDILVITRVGERHLTDHRGWMRYLTDHRGGGVTTYWSSYWQLSCGHNVILYLGLGSIGINVFLKNTFCVPHHN